MTYKENFLKNLLKYILIEFFNKNMKKITSQDLYDMIPFGDGIHDYLIIPEYFKYNYWDDVLAESYNKKEIIENIFELKFIKTINDINMDNIWKYLSHTTSSKIYNKSIVYFIKKINYGFINIDDKCQVDKQDEDNVNAEVFSIREACETQRNNKYKTIKENYAYISSAKLFTNKIVLLLSKKFIFDGLILYIKNIISKKTDDFNEIVLQEVLKMIDIKNVVEYKLEPELELEF